MNEACSPPPRQTEMSNPAEVLGESCPERARYHHHSHLALKQSQVSVGLSFRFVLLACYRFPPKVVLTSEWVQQRPSPSEGSGIRRVHPAPGSPVRNRNGSRQHEAPARLGLFKPAGPSPRLPTSWEEQARGRGGGLLGLCPQHRSSPGDQRPLGQGQGSQMPGHPHTQCARAPWLWYLPCLVWSQVRRLPHTAGGRH